MVVMAISFICRTLNFLALLYSMTLSTILLFYKFLVGKTFPFKLYNSLNFLTLSIPFYFVSCQMLSKALILTKSHYMSMMRKIQTLNAGTKAQCECSTLWSLNVGGNRYHPEKASTTVKKWEEAVRKRWAIL